jgi:hypothetical protein
MLVALLIVALLMTSAGSIHAYLTAHDSRTSIFTITVPLQNFVKDFILREHKAVDNDLNGYYTLTDEEVMSNTYNIHPGISLPKDPFIKITELAYNAYLFVEIVGENNDNFAWSVNSRWMETTLTGRYGGTVYVYKGSSTDAMVLDENNGLDFSTYILNGIDGSPNGGVSISDRYTAESGTNLDIYSYLLQADDFDDYVHAYNTLIGK